MADLQGPANAPDAVTVRPSDARVFGDADTWFKPCTDPETNDGTEIQADWLNGILGQVRNAIRGQGAPIDNASDDMLLNAIKLAMVRRATAGGSAAALTATFAPPVPSYYAGLTMVLRAPSACPSADPALNVDGLGAKIIKRGDGNVVAENEWVAGTDILITYDGTNFRLLSPTPSNDPFIRGNVTYTVGPADGNSFAGLPAALAFLKDKIIVAPAIVTLQLDAGVHTMLANIVFNHPNGDRIHIVGAAVAPVPSPASFVVTGHSSGARATDYTANLAMLRAAFGTELRFSGGLGFQIVGGNTLGLLKNVLIASAGGVSNGLWTREGSTVTVDTVAVAGFGGNNWDIRENSSLQGINIYGAGAVGSNFAVTASRVLIGSSATTHFVLTQCGANGMECVHGANIQIFCQSSQPRIQGCGVTGIAAIGDSTVYAIGMTIIYCAGYACSVVGCYAWFNQGVANNCALGGMISSQQSSIDLSGFSSSVNGPAGDIAALHGSYIYAGNYVGAPVFSPALNTLGNSRSYIEG